MYKLLNGDLLDLAERGEFDVIVQGCNCFNTFGAGLARQIKERFPDAVLVENRTSGNDFEKSDNSLIASSESKYFNATTGGAVRIALEPAANHSSKIQRCGYFSSE